MFFFLYIISPCANIFFLLRPPPISLLMVRPLLTKRREFDPMILKCLLKEDGVHFVFCPKQGNKNEVVVLNRICILWIFLSWTGSGFPPSATHLLPIISRVSPGNFPLVPWVYYRREISDIFRGYDSLLLLFCSVKERASPEVFSLNCMGDLGILRCGI